MQLVHLSLLEAALRAPQAEAVVCGGVRLTYGGLTARIDALADLLIVEGLRKGDRVLVLLDDKAEFLVGSLAVIRAGAIAVPVIAGSTPETIGVIARDCEPALAVTSRADLARLPLLRDRLSCRFLLTDEAASSPVHREAVSNPRPLAHDGGADRIAKFMDLREDDGALILYTANADGRLRGALFTHRSLIRGTEIANSVTKTGALRELVTHALTQSMGFGRARAVLAAGGTLVLTNTPGPAAAAAAAAAEWCTALSGTPECAAAMALEPAMKMAGAAARIVFIELGAPSLPAAARKELLEAYPQAAIWLQYGLTEAPRSAWAELRTERRRAESMGRPAPGAEILVVDESGAPARRGFPGEILIKGDHVAARYWRGGATATAAPAPGEGPPAGDPWFHSGDIGLFDKDGSLRVLGRKDEIINMAGVKISPLEVEEKIGEIYPGVELCVVGIPDPAGLVGEIPVLCYIPRDGRMIISSELSALLSPSMEKEKIPRIVFRMEHFPRVERKLLRQELRRTLSGSAGAAVHPGQPAQASAK